MGSCLSSPPKQKNDESGNLKYQANENDDDENVKSIQRSVYNNMDNNIPMETAIPVPFDFQVMVLPFPETFGEGRYRISGAKLGEGSFGQVYPVDDLQETGSKRLIAKSESMKTDAPQLEHEYRMYKALHSTKFTGFPKAYYYGPNIKYNMLVMDRLGTNLEELLRYHDYKFTLKSTFLLADQMLQRLQFLHDRNFIHRDLKPENWCMGLSPTERYKVFLIDFGLSKKYQNTQTGERKPYKKHYKDLIGNEMFAPLRAFDGIEQSPRDDLESLGYCFFYFRSALPWMFQATTNTTKEDTFNEIRNQKEHRPFEKYCKTSVLPTIFVTYMKDVKNMKFAERPNYDKLRKKFRDEAKKLNIKYDDQFDWC